MDFVRLHSHGKTATASSTHLSGVHRALTLLCWSRLRDLPMASYPYCQGPGLRIPNQKVTSHCGERTDAGKNHLWEKSPASCRWQCGRIGRGIQGVAFGGFGHKNDRISCHDHESRASGHLETAFDQEGFCADRERNCSYPRGL